MTGQVTLSLARVAKDCLFDHGMQASRTRENGIVGLTGGDEIRLLMRHTATMSTTSLYHRHRFPAEIIGHCVWLYFRFPLRVRDVEEMLAMRGVYLSYETVRQWCLLTGQSFSKFRLLMILSSEAIVRSRLSRRCSLRRECGSSN